jgi:hypothetical protein
MEAATLDPFTHIYMFDFGFPPELLLHIGRIFNASVHPNFIVSFYGPKNIIDEYRFDVKFIDKLESLKMHGI